MNRRERLTLELKEDLGATLLELMKTKPFDKITVDELSQKANVGRATYYRQFKSKREVIAYKLSRDWLRYEKEQQLSFETTAPLEYTRAFFEFIYSIRETNRLLIENGCRSCILEAMRYAFHNIDKKENTQEFYRDHFRAYGLLGLVEGWIEADYDLSIEEISELTMTYYYRI